MELAYSCRNAPRVYDGRIETDDEGLCLLVHTEKRRVRIPLHDSYFAEPIVETVKNASEVKVELFGVLIASRTRLRARLVGVGDTMQRGFSDEGGSASMLQAWRLMDIIALLLGCAGQQSDAPQAYTQTKLGTGREHNHQATWVSLTPNA